MSAITNQNVNTNGQNGHRCNSGGGKFTNIKIQRKENIRKDMICWGCGDVQHLEKVRISLSDQPTEI